MATTLACKDSVSVLQVGLREYYLTQEFLPKFIDDNDEKGVPELTIQDSYMNLVIVKREEQQEKESRLRDIPHKDGSVDTLLNDYEDIYTAKEPIKIHDLFDLSVQTRASHKILVYGRAGIGKTTLIHKIAYTWAQGTLWVNKLEYVFWLSLQKLNNLIPNELGIDQESLLCQVVYESCFHDTNKKDRQPLIEALKHILDPLQNRRILFLLDGYDEITGHSHSNPVIKYIVNPVLKRNGNTYVIMTSRPNAVDSVQQASKIRSATGEHWAKVERCEKVHRYLFR